MHQERIIICNTRESWGIFLPTIPRMVLRLSVVGYPNVYLYAFLIPSNFILVTSFPCALNPMALKKSSTVSPISSDKENCIHINTLLVLVLVKRPQRISNHGNLAWKFVNSQTVAFHWWDIFSSNSSCVLKADHGLSLYLSSSHTPLWGRLECIFPIDTLISFLQDSCNAWYL